MADCHSLLHWNLLTLGRYYPQSSHLRLVLKENMFALPNKTGFEQVVGYLLNIITPSKCQAEIRFPLISHKDSVVFRNKVKDILLSLNSEYPCAEIPHVTTFVLMSYGGAKLTSLVYKLSYLALKLHARQSFDDLDTLLNKMESVSGRNLPDILKHIRERQVTYDDFCELLPVQMKDRKEALAAVDIALKDKKMELMKLVGSCPKEYKDLIYKSNCRERTYFDWMMNLDQLVCSNRMKLRNLERLEEFVSKFCSYTHVEKIVPITPVVIDGDKIKENFKTKAIYSFSKKHGLLLERNGKLSLEGLMGLGNCIKSLLPIKFEGSMATSDLETLSSQIEPFSKIITDLKADSKQAYTLLSNLKRNLVVGCEILDSYICKTLNDTGPIYSNLIWTPPVMIPELEDRNSYFFSPEEVNSPWLQRLRDVYQSANSTPKRGIRLRRAMTEMVVVDNKRGQNLLKRDDRDSKKLTVPCKNPVFSLVTPRMRNRSSPSLFRSAIEKRRRNVKRPKTAPESPDRIKMLNFINKSPSLAPVEYAERESEEKVRELFDVTSDDEFGSPSLTLPEINIEPYDDFFTSQSNLGKENIKKENCSEVEQPNSSVKDNDIREIIERFRKIKMKQPNIEF